MRLRGLLTSTPAPTEAERAAGIKRFILMEDLTPANHIMLKDLQSDNRVDKVWPVDGRIFFVLVGQEQSIKYVKSVSETPDSIILSANKSN